MSYQSYYPNGWQSGETGKTPITPEALNHMDKGIRESMHAIESPDYSGCNYRIANGEIEWINPPMILGVEYRTIERWSEKPVYAKKIQYTTATTVGNTNGVTTIEIPHDISGFTGLVRCHGLVGTTAQMPYMEKNGGSTSCIGVDAANVKLQVINTTWNSERMFTFDIRYTKS